ncbi:hypothetical protein [Mesorhizobium sp. M0118]
MPATLVLACYANVSADDTFSGEIEFRCLIGGKLGAEAKGNLVIGAPGNSAIAFPGLPIVVPEPAELEFQFRVKGQDWLMITKISVIDGSSA